MKSVIVTILSLFVVVTTGCAGEEKNQNDQLNSDSAKQQEILLKPELKLEEVRGSLLEIKGWKAQVNLEERYSIMHPQEFSLQEENVLVNYGADDSESDSHHPENVKIQIQRQTLFSSYSSFDEYKEHLLNNSNDLTEPAKEEKIGNFVVLSQHTNYGPSGESFNTFVAFEGAGNQYYNILISEPGYSGNKELVRKIIETFTIY